MKVEPYDLLHLAFYEKSPFSGSCGGFRYRIEKSATEKPDGGEERRLKVYVYPEPYAFDKTEDALKKSKYFPFSEDALYDIAAWLSDLRYEDGTFVGL